MEIEVIECSKPSVLQRQVMYTFENASPPDLLRFWDSPTGVNKASDVVLHGLNHRIQDCPQETVWKIPIDLGGGSLAIGKSAWAVARPGQPQQTFKFGL